MNRISLSKSLAYSIFIWLSIDTVSGQVTQKIGGNPGTIDPKAVLELESTTKGFLLPRMTAVQVAAITNPTSGMIVFCTDCGVGSDGELRISYNGVWQTFKGNVTGNITGNAATVTTNANLTGPITSSGNTTSVASQTGTGSKFVMDNSPTLVTPVLGVATATTINNTAIPDSKTLVVTTDKLNVLSGTSSSELAGVITDETGTGTVVLSNSPTFTGAPTLPTGTIGVTQTSGDNSTALATTAFVTAANTTNANLTGPITSSGNTTSVASQTGTGSKFVMDNSPTLVTPVLGEATATTINNTAIPDSKTLVVTTDKLNVLAPTSSTELAGVISDETGTGSVVLSNSPTFTGSVTAPIYASTPQALTDAATISWNPTNGLNASVTLGGNRTLSFTTPPTVGSYGTLIVTQDGTGNRTITLPSSLTNKILGSASTATTIDLSTAANTKDILNFYYDGANCYWNVGQGYGTEAAPVITNLATNVSGTLAVANGGSGATTLTGYVKGNGTSAMTASSTIPVADVTGAAPLASPTFTGTPTLPTGTIGVTQASGNNSTALATTAFVTAANTTNANLTGPITSSGNTTSVASQTGTGSTFVMNTSPTLVTPVLGVATATSINNTAIPASKTLVVTTDKLNVLSATSSSELAGVISDETGTGSVVLSNSPSFTGTVTAPIYASTPQVLTFGSTINWNPTNGLNASVLLGGNGTLSFTSTPSIGSYGTLVVTQDGTGNRTITLPGTSNKVLGSASTTAIALSTAANAKDILNFYYDGTNYYWNVGQGYGTAAPALITNLATNVSGTLSVANGGTGAATLTGLVKGNGTGAMTAAVAGTDYVAPSGSITGNAATVTTNANLSGPITSSGNTTSVASQTGTGSTFVMNTSPTLVTPVLGVATATSINSTSIPTSKTLVVTTDKLNALAATSSSELAGVISDETGTGSLVLSASPTFTGDAKAVTAIAGDNDVSIATTEFVTSAITSANATNANLTGAVTSTGNATSLGSFTSANLATALSDETGTGVAVLATSPTLVTPVLGAATGTSLSVSGQLTSTIATGTAPLVVTSTTPVANLSIGGNAATVTTNANLTGVVTSTGNVTAIADGALSIVKTSGLQIAIDAKVADAINDASTTVAPSQNAVFDALSLKANIASPTFTGDAKAVTATAGDNDVSIATTEFVTSAVASANTTNANLTGMVTSVGNATTVVTNANLTGVVTSTGNVTAIADAALSIAKTNGLQTAIDGKVADAINDATISVAPSQNAVFDALALKANLSSPTFTGTVTSPIYASTPQSLLDGATITWNPINGLNASVTLGGNRTLSFASTPAVGSYGTLIVTQDATGNRTITLPSTLTNKVLGSSSTSTISLSTAANAKDILNFYYDGTNCYWNVGQGYGTAAAAVVTSLSTGVSGTLPVANGGTGAATLSGLVKGNGTSAMTAAVAGTDYVIPSGSITGNAATVTTNANLMGPITSSGNTTSIASQTGTGSTFVMNTSPTLVTPVLGVATATSINSTSIPTLKTLVVTTDKLNVLAATSSTELAGVISDETGTGSVVLSASPTFTGTPLAPTATAGTNTTQVATTEFVTSAIATATIPDATTSAKGKIQLAGDLSGTAALPVVAANAITTTKILDANVTTAKIADANVTTVKIADANITTAKILDANVTTAKIADINVTDAKIASVSGSKVTGNITGSAANVTGTVAITNGGTGLTTVPGNGQIDIGNGTGFTRATITAGSAITITNTAGAITISAVVRPTTEQPTVSAAQTSFILAQTPMNAKVWMFINGVRTNNNAYAITGNTLTYTPANNNGYVIVAGDRVQFDYCY